MSVTVSVSEGIAEIVLHRPAKRNALTLEMYRQLADVYTRVEKDSDIRVALLRSSDPQAFCVGMDLTEAAPGLVQGRFDISAWDGAHLKNVDLFKPVVAAVDGYCLGGGLEILLGTDIRIAAETAVFGFPEATLGMVPAGGSLVRLVRQIPYAHAMDLMLTARRISAAEALSIGLVSKVVEPHDLLDVARHVANSLTQLSQRSLRVIKESVQRLLDLPLSAAFHAEAVYAHHAFRSPDATEGLLAFAEHRPARFPQ